MKKNGNGGFKGYNPTPHTHTPLMPLSQAPIPAVQPPEQRGGPGSATRHASGSQAYAKRLGRLGPLQITPPM
jgi:hypothetical protein